MKRCLEKTLFSQQWMLLLLLPLSVKLQDDYCKPEDKMNMALTYRLLHKNVCPLIYNDLLENMYNSQIGCAQKCLQDVFCAGYNFKEKLQKKPNCQLTNTLEHNFHSCSNKDDKGWNFYHPITPRKVPCNKMKNCKNGGKTIIDLKDGPLGSDPYRCECPKRTKGKLCEIVISDFESEILSPEPEEFITKLSEWLPLSGNWSACWRVSRDGSSSHAFHAGCDAKTSTLTIVKVVQYNKTHIFGGYNTVQWGGADAWVSAPGSFMFSLRNKDDLPPFKAPLKDQNDSAIARNSVQGPTFGKKDCVDLLIRRTPVNDPSSTDFGAAYSAPSGYARGETNAQSLLAGSNKFVFDDIEVLYLK